MIKKFLQKAAAFVLCTVCFLAFAPDAAAAQLQGLPDCLRATQVSLFDGSLQGIHRTDRPAFSFQGHPEASPGPHDCAGLFDHFIELIKQYRA